MSAKTEAFYPSFPSPVVIADVAFAAVMANHEGKARKARRYSRHWSELVDRVSATDPAAALSAATDAVKYTRRRENSIVSRVFRQKLANLKPKT